MTIVVSYHSANLMFLSVNLLTGVCYFVTDIWICYLYVFYMDVCCVISIKYDDDDILTL